MEPFDYIPELSPVTVWFKLNHKTDDFEHNHIEDGHVFAPAPIPISEEQKRAWKGAKWEYEHRYITHEGVLVF